MVPQKVVPVVLPKSVPKTDPNEEVIVYSDNHSMENYTLGKQIGSGAYAVVYLGTDRRNNRKVALKIYLKEKMKDL